jgi:anti-sigma B factor antagonist
VDADVDVRRAGGVAVAVLHGDYDLGNVAALHAELLEVLRVRPTGIVIDLGEAGFCDLTALRAMANIARRAAAVGVWVRAAGPAPMVRRMLEITGLCACLPTFADVELALRGTRGRAVLPAGRAHMNGETDTRVTGRTSTLHAAASRHEV